MLSRTYSAQMARAQREIIRRALERSAGNKTHAMWELRIDRRTIQRLVKKHRLEGVG